LFTKAELLCYRSSINNNEISLIEEKKCPMTTL
jgi:hypothetical protein